MCTAFEARTPLSGSIIGVSVISQESRHRGNEMRSVWLVSLRCIFFGEDVLLVLVERIHVRARKFTSRHTACKQEIEFVKSPILGSHVRKSSRSCRSTARTLVSGRRKYAQTKTIQAQPPQTNPV